MLRPAPGVNRTWAYVIVLLLNTGGTFYVLRGMPEYFIYPVILASLIALIKTPVRGFLFYPKKIILGFFFLFAASLLLSSTYHLELALLITAFGIVSSLVILNYFRYVMSRELIIKSLEISLVFHVIILLICVAFSDFTLFVYYGIFRNPNATGLFAATALMILISVTRFVRYGKKTRILLALIGLFLTVIVIISSSRSALIGSLIGLIVWIVSKNSIFHFQTWIKLGLFAIILFFIASSQLFYDAVIWKFLHYYETGNILNDREAIWSIVTEDMRLFGHGRLAAIEEGVGESIYVAVLHQFGIISVILFVALIGLSIISPVLMKRNHKTVSSMSLLPIILLFALQGMTASIFGCTIYFLWLIAIAYIVSEPAYARAREI